MPLNAEKPKISNPLINKIRQATARTLSILVSWIQLEIILAVFLVFAIVFAFLNRPAIGFYAVFGLFVVGLFSERIILSINKRKNKNVEV